MLVPATANYRESEVVDAERRHHSEAGVVFVRKVDHGPRNCPGYFGKLGLLLPDFWLKYALAGRISDFGQKTAERPFDQSDLNGVRFVR